MTDAGIGTLESIDYKMNADDYIDILGQNIIPLIEKTSENRNGDWVFMQNNHARQ